MASVNVDEIRSRVEEDWPRIVELIERKIALKSISAEGITGEQMRRSAEFVAEELRLVGIDAQVAQAHNADGTPGAWEVIGSRIVDPAAPTVLLYAHHDVQPVPDPSVWQTEPFVATQVGDRLFGRGSADDCGGIAIHSGALKRSATNSRSISRCSSKARRRWARPASSRSSRRTATNSTPT